MTALLKAAEEALEAVKTWQRDANFQATPESKLYVGHSGDWVFNLFDFGIGRDGTGVYQGNVVVHLPQSLVEKGFQRARC